MQQKTPLTTVKGDNSRGTTLVRRKNAASFTLLRAYPSPPKDALSAGRLRGHVHRRFTRPLSPDRTLFRRFALATLPITAFLPYSPEQITLN